MFVSIKGALTNNLKVNEIITQLGPSSPPLSLSLPVRPVFGSPDHGAHLSMLMAQRLKMEAVHSMTSMVIR